MMISTSLSASFKLNSVSRKFVLWIGLCLMVYSCKAPAPINYSVPAQTTIKSKKKSSKFLTGADNVRSYTSLLKSKKVGIVTNQTGLISFDSIYTIYDSILQSHVDVKVNKTIHIVDYLNEKTKIDLIKIYAPEHGFRGTADAGELIVDGKDSRTALPIISLYGNNKKPTTEQLAGIDVMIFDIQDVGARFYTYISSLHYVMEACAENNIPLIILDRPNPNGNIVDGPILEKEHTSFVGMHPIPVLHGMTIGEYALMINGEQWLKAGAQCHIKIVPCENYKREIPYSLMEKPSPNLPNDRAINLYASLCLFEGTNVSVGRGTDKQFQIYGSPYLTQNHFSFIPKPNIGAKDPLYNGRECCGEDLSENPTVTQLELKWLIKSFKETEEPAKFFNSFFTKLAGTKKLQQQIESGVSEEEIRESWRSGLEAFKLMRQKYLIY